MATTKTWSANDSASWRDEYGGWRTDNSDVYQGQYSIHGLHKGLWFFDDSNIRSTLAGQTVLSIRLRLTRRSFGGSSSAQTPTIRHHNYSSQPSSEPSLSSANVRSTSWVWGETDWVTITTAWGAPLRDGLIRGFGIDTGGSDNPYMIFSPTAVLEVTYEPELDPPATPNTPTISALSQSEVTLTTNTPATTETWEWNPYDAGTAFAVRAVPEYTRGGLAGETYYIRVRARNSAGVSAYSSYRTILMLPPTPPTPTVAAIGETSVSLTIPAQNGASGYDWQRSTTTVVTNGSRSQTITGLSPDTTYTFRVRSRNSSGVSPYSSYRTVKTLLPAPAVPPAPTGTVLSETSIRVQWDAVAYADSYDLRVNGVIEVSSTTSRDHTLTVVDGESYTIDVRAKNSSGTSEYSDDLVLATPSIYVSPPVPTNLGPTGLQCPEYMTLTATLGAMDAANDGLLQTASWQVSDDPSFPAERTYTTSSDAWVTSGVVTAVRGIASATGNNGTGVYYLRASARHNDGDGSPTDYENSPVVQFTYTRVKVWNGSSWVPRVTKIWDGTAWVEKPLRVRGGIWEVVWR